jgi:hypothetical protein
MVSYTRPPSKKMVSDPQTQQIDYLAASSRTVNGQRHGEGNLLALLLIDHHMTQISLADA